MLGAFFFGADVISGLFWWRGKRGLFSLANLQGLPKFEAFFTPIPSD
jgi:hypothetical protein